MMTLNDLFKKAAAPAQPQQPQQPKPNLGILQNSMQDLDRKYWKGNPKLPNQQQRNSQGWTNSLYTIPSDDDVNGQFAWNAQMRKDLLAKDPNFKFTEENRWMWDARAANARIRAKQQEFQNSLGHSDTFSVTGTGYNTQAQDAVARQSVYNAHPYYNANPVILAMQNAAAKGLGQQALESQVNIAHDAANAASFSPKLMPEFLAWVDGKSWGDARRENSVMGYRQAWTDAMYAAGYTPEQVAQAQKDFGHLFKGQNADTWWGKSLNFAGDLGREAVFRDSLINLGLAGAGKGISAIRGARTAGTTAVTAPANSVRLPLPGQATGFGYAPQAAATAGKPVVQAIKGVAAAEAPAFALETAAGVAVPKLQSAGQQSDGLLGDLTTAIGLNSTGQQNVEDKLLYGSDYLAEGKPGRQMITQDANGNAVYNTSKNPLDYPLYTHWASEHGFKSDEAMAAPEAQQAYVKWFSNQPTSDASIMGTPMWQTVPVEERPKLMTTMLRRTLEDMNTWEENFGDLVSWGAGKLGLGGKSESEILSNALSRDNDGRLTTLLSDMISYADNETFDAFMTSCVGSGSKLPGGSDMDALYDTFDKALVRRINDNPNFANNTVQTLLKVGESRARNNKNADMNAPSEAINKLKLSLMNVIADKDVLDRMDYEQVGQLAKTLQRLQNIPGGVESLGEEGEKLAAAIKENLQNRLLGSVWDDPGKNFPIVASLFAGSMGWNGIADFISNPWNFWVSAAALLAGGVLFASSAFDEDEDEEDEDADYRRALRRNPYA